MKEKLLKSSLKFDNLAVFEVSCGDMCLGREERMENGSDSGFRESDGIRLMEYDPTIFSPKNLKTQKLLSQTPNSYYFGNYQGPLNTRVFH